MGYMDRQIITLAEKDLEKYEKDRCARLPFSLDRGYGPGDMISFLLEILDNCLGIFRV
jgi:hypothetical protein